MFKRSTGQSLVPLVRDLEPGRVNNLLRMLTGKLAESVQFSGGSVLIVLTRQIFVDVPTHLLTKFLTREHHRKHVAAPLKWGEQQRRPSRSSTADASEARDFRARSGSMSHHSHDISPRPIIEDNEDEQEHGHSKYDSKATSDDENPPTPPILNSTYPPQRLQTARTSISITNDAASNRSPSCSMALPPTVASRTITNTTPSRPSTDRASPASRPSALSSLDASTSFCCSCAALRPALLTCTAPWSWSASLSVRSAFWLLPFQSFAIVQEGAHLHSASRKPQTSTQPDSAHLHKSLPSALLYALTAQSQLRS
ncbi:uncharacterized protein UBRO_20934 [Ustilago bromivora]|uniref:Uncharacterized protein n=1 Tax=Ustilago bromivora TaxID=307758 RepID=A0A1K0GCW1_9BASI|nr:uncharacterized protein UBRO_20934 [Ustilago bromivora]